ncbi:MAG: zinc ribbon domain-containing protein [Candidatus Saccharicenans sp.]|nr:zinc ribbon domain-containing protein [Candidatus Saccharicenans sp.]
MGIKRCPYCRALISDLDEFCKNCGTRLLFPEDEEIEEEIPGDKIIEDDRRPKGEEEQSEVGNESTEIFPGQEAAQFDEEDELEEDLVTEEELEEVIIVDEEAAGGQKTPSDTVRASAETRETKKTPEELIFAQVEEDLPFPEEQEEKIEPGLVTRMVEELQKETKTEEASTTEKPGPGLVTQLVQELEVETEGQNKKESKGSEEEKSEEQIMADAFSTAELEAIGPTVEMGQRQVEDFLKILEEKEKERIKIIKEKKEAEETDNIPPWVSDIKDASTEWLEGGQEISRPGEKAIDELYSDEELPEEESPSRPTMGFPEKVTRSELELGESRDLEMEIKEEEETDFLYESETDTVCLGKEESQSMAGSTSRGITPLSPGAFIKAKVFDLLFMVLLWLLTIWLAARSMQVTIFKLMGAATTSLLLFLLIQVSIYFFLFYFFIGETLGDRLFRENED